MSHKIGTFLMFLSGLFCVSSGKLCPKEIWGDDADSGYCSNLCPQGRPMLPWEKTNCQKQCPGTYNCLLNKAEDQPTPNDQSIPPIPEILTKDPPREINPRAANDQDKQQKISKPLLGLIWSLGALVILCTVVLVAVWLFYYPGGRPEDTGSPAGFWTWMARRVMRRNQHHQEPRGGGGLSSTAGTATNIDGTGEPLVGEEETAV